MITVAAGENLRRVDGGALGVGGVRAVEHPMLDDVFDGFDRGRHVMSEQFASFFRDDI